MLTPTFVGSNKVGHTVVIKSARHFRIGNERDVLRSFQAKTHLRPLIDEIVVPADPPAIVLKHLDDDLLNASNTKKLNTREIKYVSKRILEALDVLHEAGYVHTGQVYLLMVRVVALVSNGQGQCRYQDRQCPSELCTATA